MTIFNQANFAYDKILHRKHPKGFSQTVPDQSLSLRDLVSRYTRGQGVTGRTDVYFDDVDGDYLDLGMMDKLELTAYAELVNDSAREVIERMNAPKASPAPPPASAE